MNPIRRETISEWSEKAWKENRCVLDFLSQQQPLVHQNPVVLTVIVLFSFRIKSHFSAKPDLSLISKTDKCFILEQNIDKKFLRSAAALLLLRRRTTTFWSAKKKREEKAQEELV